jgi:hypothetical protein
MIILTNLPKKNNLISYPIKIIKSWNNNEFEKNTLFWLECLIFWVEF